MGPNWKRVVLLLWFLYCRGTRAEWGIPCIYRVWSNVVSTATTASGKETSRASSDLFDQFVDFERGSFWCRNIIGFCFSSSDLSFHLLTALVEWLFRVVIRFGIHWRFGKVLDRLCDNLFHQFDNVRKKVFGSKIFLLWKYYRVLLLEFWLGPSLLPMLVEWLVGVVLGLIERLLSFRRSYVMICLMNLTMFERESLV